jgi:hypothetical protein
VAKSSRGSERQRYNAHPGDITGGLPMVVLINGGSGDLCRVEGYHPHRYAQISQTQ